MEKTISFDGVIYPALFFMGMQTTLAPPKTNYIDIAGSSGSFDATDVLSNGSTPYSDSHYTISLAVPWTRVDDWERKDGTGRTQEGRFFSNVHGKRCIIRLSNRPGLSLTGRVTVTRYNNAAAVKTIELSVRADPFWLEDQPIKTTFVIDTDNHFSAENLETYYKSNAGITWEYSASDAVPSITIKDANAGDVLDIKVVGLDPQKIYSFSVNLPTSLAAKYNLYSVYDNIKNQLDANQISGVSEFIIRFEIKKNAYAYAFSYPTLTVSSSGTALLANLDKPAEINYYTDRNCTVIIGEERHDIKVGSGTLYGAALPANTETYVTVVGEESGFCELSFRRGVLICTL